MNIPKLVGVAGAVLLVLAVVALPVSAAGNQYSKECPNCPDECDPNLYDYSGPGHHGQYALSVSGAGNQYSKECPNCPDECDPNLYEYEYSGPPPHD